MGIRSFHIERFSMIESEDLGGRNNIALREHKQFSIFFGFRRRWNPVDVDREVIGIRDVEITNAENGREHGASKGSSSSNSPILVEGKRESLPREGCLDTVSHGWNTSSSTNEFDCVNLVKSKARIPECALEGSRNGIKDGLDEFLERIIYNRLRISNHLNRDGHLSRGQRYTELVRASNNAE
jgi:hypothetical protein